jgi:hypothetical protein
MEDRAANFGEPIRQTLPFGMEIYFDNVDTMIADQIGFDHTWVLRTKGQLETSCQLPRQVVGKDGKSDILGSLVFNPASDNWDVRTSDTSK